MKSSLLAKRYAQALFDLAVETKQLEDIAKDMLLINSVLDESRELRRVLDNPVLDDYKKVRILDSLFGKKIKELTLKFLHLIVKKGREGILTQTCKAFDVIYKDYMNILPVTLTIASEIDEKTKKEILEKLAPLTDKKLEVTEIIDPEIIGGFKLNFEDYQYNNSVKAQLQRLAKVFSDNPYVSKI
ncbi:MAG: ATP synthase F1 subunit delta [Bacteroidetes bacterium]|nr:MAG: ATP synthase F1 subunit delta [Bacteroidota bacterium]RLD49469.1 MAG: ATP synthase F1 subunit delta [Bacteroidota bacterium]RLD74413.1 MAG: ATP synthase F1 subunit delta [Bacteroidota bacterium]RLD89016.1 MAG: ATP synthase F1 subunit delta [Bacteroidota bacterium]